MSNYVDIVSKEVKPTIESLKDDMLARRDKTFFWATGTQVYVGRQGSGKTISAVKHVLDIKRRYPKAILVSNIALTTHRARNFGSKEELLEILKNFDPETEYIAFSGMEGLSIVLTGVNNGFLGVVYLVDEIHTYFNALDSKNIPMYVFTEISQQRKQRKLVIGTSQLFLRMAKPLREQCDNLIICSTFMGFLTIQRAFDGMTLTQDYDGSLNGTMKKMGWFFHRRKLRKAFDTYQKVVSGSEQYDLERPIQIKNVGKTRFGIG